MSETKNAVLSKWGDGFFEAEFAPSIASYGRRGGFLDISAVKDGTSAFWTTANSVAQIIEPAISITIEIEPEDLTVEPITAFRIGDRVTAPNLAGTPTEYRVASISGTEDNIGRITWTIELESPRELQEYLWRRWLRRTSNGTLDGRNAQAAPSSPSVIQSGTVTDITHPWSGSGGMTTNDGDRGTPDRPREAELVYRLNIECDTAGVSGPTTATFLVDDVPSGTVTLSSGADTGYTDLSVPIYVDETNLLNVEFSPVGGHLGINVTALAVPAN